ncbi:hypothetical protein ACLMJK_004708 [Lecanora helva]
MSWDGKPEGSAHVEEVDSTMSRGFRAKTKAHLRKFWWLHLIIFISCALIIILPLIYVGFPHISQNYIDDSTLTIQSLVFSDPTPDSFHLKQTGIIGNKSPYHPNLDAFNASLSLDGGAPYAYVKIPKVHATRQATSIVDQEVSIVDLMAFTDYTTSVLQNEEVKVEVKGRTPLHEMSFPTTTVDYKKTATMKGFNKLNGFNVTSFSILLTPEPDGTNMLGTVYIPNPTVMTISMGNVTFTNYLPTSIPLGTTTLTNLTLAPGNNTVPMRSTVNQTLVLEQLQSTYKNGFLPVDIVGNSSVYEGQHLPYFEKALASVTQHVVLDVGSALKKVGFDPSLLGGSPP